MAKPLLISRATEREAKASVIPGRFDGDASVWIVDGPQGAWPAASAVGNDALEILTKTRVRQEADDEEFSLLEIVTKTHIQQEADDEVDHPGVRII